MLTKFLSFLLVFAFASSSFAEKSTTEKVHITIHEDKEKPTSLIALDLVSGFGKQRVALPAFEEGESSLRFIVEIPSATSAIDLITDGKKAYTFTKTCGFETPLIRAFAMAAMNSNEDLASELRSEIVNDMALQNRTEYDFALEFQKRIKARTDDICYFGEFIVSLTPNGPRVLSGGPFAIRDIGPTPRIIELGAGEVR